MKKHIVSATLGLFGLALVLGLALQGCAEDSQISDFDRATATARSGYPATATGTTTGETIADLQLSLADGSATSLGAIHRDGGNRLLIVSTAAGWCTACIEDQPRLQTLHEQHYDAGLFVMVALFEDLDYNPSTPDYATTWQTRYGLEFAVVDDNAGAFGAYYDTAAAPMNMLVDVETMEILYLATGWDQSAIDAVIQSKLY